ncbi:hypothetical protein BDM02DRAFT_1902019 [Thelephora ganbajun]|uniref:Uncharacterized protein n=1 Tax=Thelephora ganbajun TaxID=370292 RepID=A0ACB6ZUS4_THEGA|nr:hypothetical protein BDM02DRAFT_1902019 [Thelephora ganbajun]
MVALREGELREPFDIGKALRRYLGLIDLSPGLCRSSAISTCNGPPYPAALTSISTRPTQYSVRRPHLRTRRLMESAGKGEQSEKESPPLQVDPKCFQDALRAFFQPIKTDDPRLDFYTMYNREATGYDTDYVKKYDDDLNTTLIFAGLFSAVSSAFVIGIQPKLESDPNEKSAALLRAILLTLNRSAIPGETPTVPPVQEHPPSEIVTVTCLTYASLLMSLLAAFVAMLGKQWLNRYMRNSGGSMIDRCGDRQRKFDGLRKWRLDFFIESLPVMLQIALLLLACGLCWYMAVINPFVAGVLIAFTVSGVMFYVGIVIAGTSSHDCPFQTPGSSALRSLWTKISPHLFAAALPLITPLRNLGEIVQCHIFRIMIRLPHNFVFHRQY